jgi:amino acid transporter
MCRTDSCGDIIIAVAPIFTIIGAIVGIIYSIFYKQKDKELEGEALRKRLISSLTWGITVAGITLVLSIYYTGNKTIVIVVSTIIFLFVYQTVRHLAPKENLE